MDHGEAGVEFFLHGRGPFESLTALRTQIDGAQDVPKRRGLLLGRFLQVHAGPHGAIRIVQHLGGDGSEDELAERAVAVGGHHDQAGILLVGIFHDLARGIAFEDHAPGFGSGKFAGQEGLQLFLDLGGAVGVQLRQHGAANFQRAELIVRRSQNVQQRQLRMKMIRKRLGVPGRAQGSLREIYG